MLSRNPCNSSSVAFTVFFTPANADSNSIPVLIAYTVMPAIAVPVAAAATVMPFSPVFAIFPNFAMLYLVNYGNTN